MNKRALMLTAATAALMTGPAYASCPSTAPDWTSITTDVQTYVDTACANKNAPSSITITTTGQVVVAVSPFTTPAVTVDSGTASSPNTIFNAGTISYQGVTSAVGVQLTANNNVGGLDNEDLGIINLEGAGDDKTGILIALPSTTATAGTFTGGVVPSEAQTELPSFFSADKIAVLLESGSTVEVEGTSSYGIQSATGTVLNGDIDIAGTLETTPTDTTSTASTGNYAIYLGGQMGTAASHANLVIMPGGVVESTGADSIGIAVGAPTPGAVGIYGSIANYGTISTIGIASPSTATNAANPEGGQALYVGASVTGGILNAGKSSASDTTNSAIITSEGTGPAVDITTAVGALTPGSVTIGAYADTNDPDFASGYSFINRGSITAGAENPNVSVDTFVVEGSSASTTVTFVGGLFDSGTISATSSNNVDGSATSATALLISDYASIPKLVTNSAESGTGIISASTGGPFGGTAIAIDVTQNGVLPEIDNYGTISATATSSEVTIASLTAEAIVDDSGENASNTASGTISLINNFGTIEATATTLDNGEQIARAINLTGSTQTVTVNNYIGTIEGDIVFGVGENTLNDGSTNAQAALIEGNIYYGGDPKADDNLTIYDNATLTGTILEGAAGRLNLEVQGGGVLDLENTTIPLNSPILNTTSSTAASLLVDSLKFDTASSVTMSVSQPFNIYGINPATGEPNVSVPAIISANTATIGNDATFKLAFGSFVGSPTDKSVAFDLISTPTGEFTVSGPQLASMAQAVQGNIPFLFQSSSSLCTQNVTGSPIPCASTIGTPTGTSQLDLVLVPKAPGPGPQTTNLGLTGYALKLFPYANEALATDSTLGAGVVNAITSPQTAQSIYASFAPDVSGATRAVAISLTDSATNVVAARQRELNMYANQEGDTTLWGQQFAERLSQDSTPGTLGYNDTGFGFALGMDTGDPTDGRYGGAFTFFSGNAVEKDPVDVRTGSSYYLGTFYTNWRGKGLFLDTQWTAGWGELQGKRSICACDLTDTADTDNVERVASGDRPTQMLAGGISTGAIFNFAGTVITPEFNVDGLTLREDSYTESGGQNLQGGDGFDLRVQPYYTSSARGFLGLDLREDIGFGDFYVQPEVRGGYRYDFLDGAEKLKVNFVGVTPIDQFSITGPDPAKGNIVATGGLAITTGAWSIGVAYDYLRANSGNTQQDGMITLLGRI